MRTSPESPESPPDALEEPARLASRQALRLSSGFPRGAALLTSKGTVFASPEMTDPHRGGVAMCAERAALYRAIMAGEKKGLRALLVRGGRTGRRDAGPPCGACLQVLAEFAPDLRVWWGTAASPRGGLPVRVLLPGAFNRNHMDNDVPPGRRPAASAHARSATAASRGRSPEEGARGEAR